MTEREDKTPVAPSGAAEEQEILLDSPIVESEDEPGVVDAPGVSGSNPLRYLARPVAASVASVRPWKELFIEMISLRPVALPILRANLIMPSLASAPEFAKKTTPSKQLVISFSARRGITSFI